MQFVLPRVRFYLSTGIVSCSNYQPNTNGGSRSRGEGLAALTNTTKLTNIYDLSPILKVYTGTVRVQSFSENVYSRLHDSTQCWAIKLSITELLNTVVSDLDLIQCSRTEGLRISCTLSN